MREKLFKRRRNDSERRTAIDPQKSAQAKGGFASTELTQKTIPLQQRGPTLVGGLEPGTCGLTVRPVIARKAAPDNDFRENGR